ncbi:MAG: hypothetical protein MR691_10090 [Clostridium sp.]|nr:hypothetical protein [Clostridium sp.]
MEQELLKQILSKLDSMETKMNSMETKMESMETKINSMESDIKELKDGQERIEEKIETIYDQTANLTEFKTEVNIKLDELCDVENVTKLNCYEIAKLKSVK